MRQYCLFCKTKLEVFEKMVCVDCGERIDQEGYGFFVNLHNERYRTYWNKKQQTVSCRVRFTKKSNAKEFRQNTIDFIYNYNIDSLKETLDEIAEEDQKLIARKMGISEVITKDRKLTSEEKRKQYSMAMRIREMGSFDIMELLELQNVVATKIRGYYKELFFLKCYMNGLNPAIILRGLYRLKLNNHFDPSIFYPNIKSKETSILNLIYRKEIILIVKGYLEVISANRGSIKLIGS